MNHAVRQGESIQKAIDAAHAKGGGRVVLEPGVHVTGTLFMKSHVELPFISPGEKAVASAILEGEHGDHGASSCFSHIPAHPHTHIHRFATPPDGMHGRPKCQLIFARTLSLNYSPTSLASAITCI